MNFRVNLVAFAFLVLVGSVSSLIAQSTNLDSPTSVTSNIISGSLDKGEKGRYYYYSLIAGSGEVNFTLSLGNAVGGGMGVFQVGLTILDENEVVLASFSATSGTYNGGQGTQIITLKRRQRLILQFGHTSFSSAGGEFRLRIGGAVEFEGSTSPPPKGISSREVSSSPSECLPKRGTLIIKMKDGSKKIIDLTEADTVTVVP
jgi:hypothetical protein